MKMKQAAVIGVLIVWGLLFCERPVHAYLDPGSGSMLLQVLLGGTAAIAVILRLYWGRLLELLRIRSKDAPTKQDG
jgi:hypothetical protein